MKSIPKILYKYRTLSEFTMSIFSKLEIYFANPREFNDPFDCFIPIRYDMLTKEEHRERQIQLLKRLRPDFDEKKILAAVEELVNNKKFRPHEQLEMINASEMERIQNSIRVFCLSEEANNILLWSHYASLHSGICIGFDTDQLYKDTGAGIGRVVYSDQYPIIKPTPLGDMKDLIVQVASKSECWSYEKEYRFVFFENRPIFKISPAAINQVIFGIKTKPEEVEQILKMLNLDIFSHVSLFKAERVPNEFKVQVKSM